MVRHCMDSVTGKLINGPMPINEALAWLEQAQRDVQPPDPWIDVYRADLLSSIGRSRRRAISTRRPRCTWPTEA